MTISPSSSNWAEDADDLAILKSQLIKVLEFEQTGAKISWRNPETGNGGVVMVERTYFTDPKTPCRDFIVTLDVADAAPLVAEGTGCRINQSKWQLSEELELSSFSAIKRGWALPESDISEEVKAAALEALPDPDPGSEAQPICALSSNGGSSIEAKELDIVFLVDTTTSMDLELGDIQASLMASVRVLQRMAASLNVGVVAFRDSTDTYETRTFQLTPMTENNLRRLGIFVEGLEAKGGGDVPEAINEALLVAKAMAWRPTALGQIVVISDAPAHKAAELPTFDTARNFHTNEHTGPIQRRVSTVYTGSANRLSSRDFYQRLAKSGGGCFSSHQSTLIENVLISVL